MRRSLVLAAVAAGFAASVDCGRIPCDVGSCPLGCCDAEGRCQTVSADKACGTGGGTCQDCTTTNRICVAQICVSRGGGGGRDGGVCGAANCAGCCEPGGCRVGSFDNACGTGGAACRNCTATADVCRANVCVAALADAGPCGPANCSGCCDSAGICRSGAADAACGALGAFCRDCAAGAQICVNATCQPRPDAGPLCGPANCPSGCCDATDACRLGTGDTACGQGGAGCANCLQTGATCFSRRCVGGTDGGGCGPGNCAGCCTAAGGCLGGASNTACGLGGNACLDCTSVGAICSGQSCVSGGDGGCRVIGSFGSSALTAAYNNTGSYAPPNDVTFAALYSSSGFPRDELHVEVWHGYGPDGSVPIPYSVTFSSAMKFFTCDLCAYLAEGCSSPSTCARTYFGQAGTMSVSRADKTPPAGRLQATLSGVRLDEWDTSGDTRILGGRCVSLPSQTVDVTWPVDGGAAD